MYNVDVEPAVEGESSSGITVWDYYSREENGVLVVDGDDEMQVGKKLTKQNKEYNF